MESFLSDATLASLLVENAYITPDDLKAAQVFAKRKGIALHEALVHENFITKPLLGQAVAESYDLPYADLTLYQPDTETIRQIPQKTAQKYRIILYKQDEKGITVATDTPTKKGLQKELQGIFPKKNVSVVYTFPEDIENTLLHYRQKLETRFSSILQNKNHTVAPELIREIFADAVLYKASDIHFEPQENEVVIRFRVDGMLQEAGKIDFSYYENVLNRLKVQSHLRVDEHFSTQDGAFRHQVNDQEGVDVRISVVPTVNGEKITLRLLARYMQGFGLEDIGLSEKNKNLLLESAKKPFGMILVTGPTGSGKTTTLYSLLKILNQPEVNITTIEDPVEYRIAGINQIQVNTETHLTFAKGLRSIVRQDPDIILVGEIRDAETSEIAVNAALTGHLLLSTFHANDAPTAIPRLLDMGIEPFLLASTLEVIIAQRLVRKICPRCRYSTQKSASEIKSLFSGAEKYFSQKAVTLYQGKGCGACNHTGYKGRIALFEIIPVRKALEDRILENPSAQEIWKVAQKEGAEPLFMDGIQKVKSGITSLEEVLRVAAPE